MATQHTNGPWEVVALNRLGPFAIRMAYNEGLTFYGINTVHREPDARLIAIAPDMHEALSAVVEHFDGARSDKLWMETERLCRAALAKIGAPA